MSNAQQCKPRRRPLPEAEFRRRFRQHLRTARNAIDVLSEYSDFTPVEDEIHQISTLLEIVEDSCQPNAWPWEDKS
jgi:hypothetical protein